VKLTVSYHGGTRHDITSGAHRVVTDQPIEDGGQAAGMSFCRTLRRFTSQLCGLFRGSLLRPSSDLDKGLSGPRRNGRMAERPHRVGQVTLAIHLPHRITAEQSDRLPQSGEWLHRASNPSRCLPAWRSNSTPSPWGKAIVKRGTGIPVSARRNLAGNGDQGLGGTLALGQIVSRVFVRSHFGPLQQNCSPIGLETECG